jgi:hypothetical protein
MDRDAVLVGAYAAGSRGEGHHRAVNAVAVAAQPGSPTGYRIGIPSVRWVET